ncbi:MAG: 2-(1,2-epoxy-1,2-dihydrophenyl)acetyl-CoA isomerase [Aureispira sp.]|nr:2-(1,2-epoxy-1,2-dihydrophenyl)acetyl-CoA isomerase [Aureispira sp.]
MSDTILFSQEGGVATITLNRPKAFNSFNREMALALIEKLEECANNKEVRAIVLTGEGRAFCAGQDLAEATSETFSFKQALSEHYNPIVSKIRSIEKPIIGAINGVAAGAGANIAFICDLTIAKKSVNFTQAFSKIGLVPDSGGTFSLPRLVGMQRATAMMMLSEKVSAEEAERIGLIYKAVEDEEYAETVAKTAAKMARMPTKALGLTKRLLNVSMSNDWDTQLQLEGQLQIEASETYDYNEGVQSFLEKRRPVFKGE